VYLVSVPDQMADWYATHFSFRISHGEFVFELFFDSCPLASHY